MLRLALLLVLFVFIARAFWRMVDGVLEGLGGGHASRRQRPGPAGVQMARDPICGTYVVPDRAVVLSEGGRRTFFCSAACRDTYRQRTSAAAADHPHGRPA